MADLELFIFNNKLVPYIRGFLEFYNWKNCGQINEIHRIIEIEKMPALTVADPYNLSAYRIIEISLVQCKAYVVSRDQNKFIFFVNNYIDWDQFNSL